MKCCIFFKCKNANVPEVGAKVFLDGMISVTTVLFQVAGSQKKTYWGQVRDVEAGCSFKEKESSSCGKMKLQLQPHLLWQI